MEIQAGQGWRLRMDPQRQPFVVLVGGPDWAVELTAAEAAQLQAGVRCLIEQCAAIAAVLMPEETLELEHASSGLWLQLNGFAERWSLRFVLEPQPAAMHPARGVEGGWDQDASAAFAAALLALRLPAAMGNPA
ncbi:MAG: DUF1818 family protein [Cyanobacteria bacterium K_DeepCast_35m_m2_155]|nr:DUF1818 family protein [Cyanobacteria bacterium K_DeepCast_35m_m2_155]